MGPIDRTLQKKYAAPGIAEDIAGIARVWELSCSCIDQINIIWIILLSSQLRCIAHFISSLMNCEKALDFWIVTL